MPLPKPTGSPSNDNDNIEADVSSKELTLRVSICDLQNQRISKRSKETLHSVTVARRSIFNPFRENLSHEISALQVQGRLCSLASRNIGKISFWHIIVV